MNTRVKTKEFAFNFLVLTVPLCLVVMRVLLLTLVSPCGGSCAEGVFIGVVVDGAVASVSTPSCCCLVRVCAAVIGSGCEILSWRRIFFVGFVYGGVGDCWLWRCWRLVSGCGDA